MTFASWLLIRKYISKFTHFKWPRYVQEHKILYLLTEVDHKYKY